ncbi:RTC4-like domain-containing protein [Xylariaceae sp. FL0594]|nr:RTC4-like domain-containing protein [Xylariaceae sp. FL0594]
MKGHLFTGHKPRSVGLTRSYAGGSPLNKIGGRVYERNHKPITPSSSSASSTMKGGTGTLEHDDITAPPESSDDEGGTTSLLNGAVNDDSDSDKEYQMRRTADIIQTDFSNRASSNARKSRGRALIRAPGKTRTRVFLSGENSSLVDSTRSSENEKPRGPSQLEKEAEETRSRKDRLKKRKKKPVTVKYGAAPPSSRSNAPNSNPPISKDAGAEGTDTPKRTFRHHIGSSPLKTESPPKKFFKSRRLSSDLDEAETPLHSFKKIPMHSLSPSSPPRKKNKLRVLDMMDEDSPGVDGDVASQRDNLEASQKPVFRVPQLDDSYHFDDSAVPLDDEREVFSDHSDIHEIEQITIPRCPLCDQVVDRALLERHAAKGKMTINQQTTFCRLHKQQSARELAVEKGYPEIDWANFGDRCAKHQKLLRGILEGTERSHYRSIFEERVNAGKNRTLLKNKDNLTPGYYGPRGLFAMTDFILHRLAHVVRKRAVEDRLVSARSYTGFVQAVLVPELAVRLIMEDMAVAEPRAREILEETTEVGELLQEEVRDVVTARDSDDDESRSGPSGRDDETHYLEDDTDDEDELAML